MGVVVWRLEVDYLYKLPIQDFRASKYGMSHSYYKGGKYGDNYINLAII